MLTGPSATINGRPVCEWCGATLCNPDDALHGFLRKHGFRTPCWSEMYDGWVPLLEDLVRDLRALGWDGRVDQVKQKLGELRFYATGLDAAMKARVRQATELSLRTCEYCGAPGTPQRRVGTTACEACAVKFARKW